VSLAVEDPATEKAGELEEVSRVVEH